MNLDTYSKLLTPIRRLREVRLVGAVARAVISMCRLFTDKLRIPPVIVSIREELNNNGLALPLRNMIILGEKYSSRNAPEDVADVSVGFIAGHEIGHIHDYVGIERGRIHRFFALFPFILYEYLKETVKSSIWTNIGFRAIMWTLSFLLYQSVCHIILPALIPYMTKYGIPVVFEIQAMILSIMLWNTYMLGVKLRSEIFANNVAIKLLRETFDIRQGSPLMREEKYYLTEIIVLNTILGLAFIFPQVSLALVSFFSSILGFYLFMASVSTFAPIIAIRKTQEYGKY
jgi:hypothetical protein